MKKVQYKSLVDKESFIGKYMEYMSSQETAYAYDFWTAIWLMSVAIGRVCFIDRPRAPIYLNWFMLLIAESGVTRKSTSVKVATKVARTFLNNLTHLNLRHAQIIENKVTPEQLESMLHKQSVRHGSADIVISVSELIRLLGKEKYKMGLPGILTDLYDSPDLQTGGGTKDHGEYIFKNVVVNFISASTPSWLAGSINRDVIEGGFTSRVIWIVEEKRKHREPWPKSHKDEQLLLEEFNSELMQIYNKAKEYGTIKLSHGGFKKYSDWYNTKKESSDSFKSSFESREDSHVLRLAAMLSINDNRWHIDGHDVEKAIRIISEIKNNGAKIFVGGANRDKLISGISRMKEKLLLAGKNPITQTELYTYCRNYLSKEEFKTLILILHELLYVQKFEDKETGPGRKATYWRGTTKLTNSGMVENVLKELS